MGEFREQRVLASEFRGLHPRAEWLDIRSMIRRWGEHALRFEAEWVLRGRNLHLTTNPDNIPITEGLANVRKFARLNGCDVETGLLVRGPISKPNVDGWIALLTNVIYLNCVNSDATKKTRAAILAKHFRLTLDAAAGLLDLKGAFGGMERPLSAGELVQAALPHFKEQADACRRWLARDTPTLALNLSADIIRANLRVCAPN